MDNMGHDDLVVDGGGIAGLYCCLHAPAGMRIALFEATARVGGKIETVPMEGALRSAHRALTKALG